MAVYNPYKPPADNARLGAIWTYKQGQDTFNPGASPFQIGTANNSLEKSSLGYGDQGEGIIGGTNTKDYAFSKWLSSWSPYLTSKQIQQVRTMRANLEDAQNKDQYRSNGSTRFGDVLGATDVIRMIQEASPYERGQVARYLPTRYRES